jgi:hypothetical protein
MAWYRRRITVSDDTITAAHQLTVRQSLLPNLLGKFYLRHAVVLFKGSLILTRVVTILFFLWGFAYGLLDGK